MKLSLLAICTFLLLTTLGSAVLAEGNGQVFLPLIEDGREQPTTPVVTSTTEPTPTDEPTPTPEPTATEPPDQRFTPGSYEGTSSVAFTATETGDVCDFEINIRSGLFSCRISPADCSPIIDDTFVFTNSLPGATYAITGTWTTETIVDGTYDNFIWCEGSFILIGGTPSWNAEKIN